MICRREVLLFVTVVLGFGAVTFAQPQADSTWPMFRHDPCHTGVSPLSGAMDTCHFLWSYATHGIIRSSPSLADIDNDGKLEAVVGSWDSNMYAINAENGSLLWSHNIGPRATSSPATGDIDNDGYLEVLIGSENDRLYALNGEDGSLLWSYVTGDWVESSPVVGDIDADGKLEVVVGSWDDCVYALNGENGSLVWSYTTQGDVSCSPVLGDIDNDGMLEVVIGSWDDNIYALNAEDGSFLWSYPTGALIESSPALGDIDEDGKLEVVVGSGDGNLYALNGENGTLVSSYPTGHIGFSSPALGDIDGDGKLEAIVGSSPWNGTSNIHALNAEDGSLLWSYTPGGRVDNSPAIVDINGDSQLEVIIGANDSNLYAFRGVDGTLLWRYNAGASLDYSSPALGDIDGDGKLEIVFGCQDYKIYAINDRDIGYARRDVDINGTRTGTYLETWTSDNTCESIQEEESRGSPNKRYSYLEHKWVVSVVPGSQAIFHLEAYHTPNNEGDDFVFAYSINNSDYIDMITVSKTADDDVCQTYVMPSLISDTIYIRVKDTDQTPGNRTLESIYIDYMFIEPTAILDSTPPVISNVASSNIASTVATITWDTDEYSNSTVRYDADGGPVYDNIAFSGNLVIAHSITLTGLSPSTTYYYVVESTDLANNIATSNEYDFTTTAGGGELHVATIEMSLAYNGPFTRGLAEVTIADAAGVPVSMAQVTGHWSGLTNDTDQFMTGDNGRGSCDSGKLRNPAGWFIFTVDSVLKDGWVYNAAANIETSDSISVGGGGGPQAVGDENIPTAYALYAVHPNPFNSKASVRYALPENNQIQLFVYDASGRVVRVLVNKSMKAGNHMITWDGTDQNRREVAEGVYFIKFNAGNYFDTAKLLLLRRY